MTLLVHVFILNDEPACAVMGDLETVILLTSSAIEVHACAELYLEGATREIRVISEAVSVPQVCDIIE